MMLYALVLAAIGCADRDGRGPEESNATGDGAMPLGVLGWEAAASAFPDAPAPPLEAFDALAHDADGDGDMDLLLHAHHVGEMELWRNDGVGNFAFLGQAASGQWDNPGVPDLFGDLEAVEASIDAGGLPGLYIWHDVDRNGSWRARYKPAPDAAEPFELTLRVNASLQSVSGFESDGGALEAQDFTVSTTRATQTFSFSWFSPSVAVQSRVEASAGGVPVALFAGPSFAAAGTGSTDLWKNDPHGLAWADVTDGPLPDLFATRGALTGNLAPPEPPKVDGLWVDGAATPWQRAEGVVPGDYARGRQVAWVDVDGDAVPEMHIGCEDTPNVLLQWQDGVLVDIAGAAGLASVQGDSSTWLDVDGDGDDDLVWLRGNEIRVSTNEAGVFEEAAGADIGLVFPAGSADFDPAGIFDDYALVPVDADSDGDLDLWFSGHGGDGAVALYRFHDGAWTDVTEAVGLADFDGGRRLLPADLDVDGRVDLLAVGSTLQWLRLTAEGTYQTLPIDAREDAAGEAVVLDANGDGWPDIVRWGGAVGRSLLRSSAPSPATPVVVSPVAPDAAVGAMVSVLHASGTTTAFRYGSHANTWISQALPPLSLASPVEDPVIRVTWSLNGAVQTWDAPTGTLLP